VVVVLAVHHKTHPEHLALIRHFHPLHQLVVVEVLLTQQEAQLLADLVVAVLVWRQVQEQQERAVKVIVEETATQVLITAQAAAVALVKQVQMAQTQLAVMVVMAFSLLLTGLQHTEQAAVAAQFIHPVQQEVAA
jgi:hypothetical protein